MFNLEKDTYTRVKALLYIWAQGVLQESGGKTNSVF